MGRAVNLVLLAAMIIGAVVTYNMKHRAEVVAGNVARLQAAIDGEKDEITLLKAEWSLLTQPARLQVLVEKYADHFQLEPFTPEHIATVEEIPFRPLGEEGDARDALARIAAGQANGMQ